MKSILLKASAGSGKTTRLTAEVFQRILLGGKFITALTFTRAATTEMRLRIMKEIAKNGEMPLPERLRLIMEAGASAMRRLILFSTAFMLPRVLRPGLPTKKLSWNCLGK